MGDVAWLALYIGDVAWLALYIGDVAWLRVCDVAIISGLSNVGSRVAIMQCHEVPTLDRPALYRLAQVLRALLMTLSGTLFLSRDEAKARAARYDSDPHNGRSDACWQACNRLK